MKLSTCIKYYLDDCYALSERTKNLYAWHLGRFLDAVSDQDVHSLNVQTVRHYMAHLRRDDGGDYSKAFLDQVWRTLHTFFAWCVNEELLEKNLIERVRRPRVPKKKSPRLSVEQVARLLEAVATRTGYPERNLAMVCLMLDSGLRRGEVVGLKLSDIDLEVGLVRVFGKDQETRDIPIGDKTREALEAYLSMRPHTNEKRLFVTADGKRLTYDGLGTLMHRLKERANIPALRCHLLRHTFGNLYIRNGGSLRRLKEVMGHEDITTTSEIYLNPEWEELVIEHRRVSPLNNMPEIFPS